MRTIAIACLLLLAASVHAQSSTVSPAACERLAASLMLPDTTVTSAEPIVAGRFSPPGPADAVAGVPAFCRVAMTIRPTPDSDIRSEVWLPMADWNGKFLMVGNGGWGGSIQYGALADGVRRGYATASTDTGHVGGNARFAPGHPEKLIDFGYRSVHLTAVHSKAVVAALYDAGPRLSYFDGCSGGGRQSFMEAQRYPADFDGIIAGAPGYDRTSVGFQTIGMAQATHATPASFIPQSKLPLIHEAAMAACDALDGLEDGLISDPVQCDFDPGVLQCEAGARADCLTEPQVEAARRIYASVVDPRTGEVVSTGMEPGSELHWAAVAGDEPHYMYHDLYRWVVFNDPDWDFRTLDVAEHLDRARAADDNVMAATSTDIEPFIDRGGRLLIYHGWADQNIPPQGSTMYYERLVEDLGRQTVEEGVRLYMAPGMGHCRGGHGPDEFDALAVLEQWREQGMAPEAIIATQRDNGLVTRTRPLCPYPQVARYDGSGDIDAAENFRCEAP